MFKILKRVAENDKEEISVKEAVDTPDEHLDDAVQEESQTLLIEEEKEQKLAQYHLWLSWTQQRQEALDQMELKLRRMRRIAREAMAPGVSKVTQEGLNQELKRLESEVQHLDKVSREKEMMLEEMEQALKENEPER